MSTINPFARLEDSPSSLYGDPETAITTYEPAYPVLSSQFHHDYYGPTIAETLGYTRDAYGNGDVEGQAQRTDTEVALPLGSVKGQHTAARVLPPHGGLLEPSKVERRLMLTVLLVRASVRSHQDSRRRTRHPSARNRPTNFPSVLDQSVPSITQHDAHVADILPGRTSLPRSASSLDSRSLAIGHTTSSHTPAIRTSDAAQDTGDGGTSLGQAVDILPKPISKQETVPPVPSNDNEEDNEPDHDSRARPGRKRTARGSEEAPTPKRAKASNVVARTTTAPPLHAVQALVLQPSSSTAPPGIEAEKLLQGSNGRAETSADGCGELNRDRIPLDTQMPLGTVITVAELAWFHPHCFQFPEVAKRMIRNKVASLEIARMQLEAAGEETSDKNLKTLNDRLKYQYTKGGQLAYPHKYAANNNKFDKKFVEAEGPRADLTADQWRFRSDYSSQRKIKEVFGHVKLEVIYEPVSAASRPTGKGRGKLTQYLEFAEQYDAAHPNAKLDTSHWDWVASKVNAQDPQLSTGFATLDHEVMAGLRAAWKA
ncbi:hypothetical protein CLAFUW4_02434 [Fulvia fulva]|nr:hypothetical protein CLAFUR4_02429 [Fulvia fulva]KAK4633215.1 hypothetical protein CLAFUR0_02433 [Fulvia fulva]WPV10761.1 hypothetical protein CLAFUW4_02434 [Fulvia fulva]WPV25680.1 hypothetical protein CLAFUW7_02434 [Fulvia fulva]